MKLKSYAQDRWFESSGTFAEVHSARDGKIIAHVSSAGLDVAAMVRHARAVGGPNLRRFTFHERAAMLKALALDLGEHKNELYELSFETGATAKDHLIDIDGGIGTMFSYASKGRRELPDGGLIVEGAPEPIGKGGTFVGRHVLTPIRGVAVHINAYNFPCWGMLEKLAPALLAGVPAIVKPATATAYVAQRVFALIAASNVLPPGAVQLIVGGTGDLLDHLDGQDVVSFTGSLETSLKLRAHPSIARKAVRFIAERDSLNAAVLGRDAAPGTPEFDLFVREVVREMTAKAGQKCTAIRRAFVPRDYYDDAASAIGKKLSDVVVGDPRRDDVRMGALVSADQRADVLARVDLMCASEARVLFGDPKAPLVEPGAYLAPILLGCLNARDAHVVHETEAFGPVATLMPYDDTADAIDLVNRGEGSLVASVYTYDESIANELVAGIAPYHGRILVLDRDCARESTGHGSPLPMLVHGGPGRAGGGEELGGMRGVHHYMQRTAIQGSPARLASLTHDWSRGAAQFERSTHPFRFDFEDLIVGQTVRTAARTITLADIETFATFTGDTFYAHMDEVAAKANPFFGGRVAHGYLVLSFAAGLFVDPAPGPVLANYGLDTLRFLRPVAAGDAISVRLTVKAKTARKPEYGEVRWDVEVSNQDAETVATYELLTMNATKAGMQSPLAIV